MSISGALLHARARGAQAQHHRHARRSQLPGRRARCAAGRRGGALRRLGRGRGRGHDLAPVAPLRRARQSRVVFVNHLDRERADFGAALASMQEQLSPRCVAIAIPIGAEKDFRGVIDVLHMVAYEDAGDGSREAEPGADPGGHGRRGGDLARAPRGGRRRGLRRPHGEVPRGRGDHRRRAARGAPRRGAARRAVPRGVRLGDEERGHARAARPDRRGRPRAARRTSSPRAAGDETSCSRRTRSTTAAYAFKTVADAHVGRINFVRVFSGTLHADVQLVNGRTRHEGAHRPGARGAGQGAPPGPRARARATSAPCRSSRTSSPATCSPSAR